jgi:ABC-type molybdate transport system permease subunit
VLSVIGTAFGVLMIALAIPGMLAGYGLLRHRSWARLLAMIIAVLGLVNFPFGTVIGIYALFVLSQQTAIEYFEPRLPAR